jgi:hypothetical protein
MTTNSGDFGEFASFVGYMEEIAKVSRRVTELGEVAIHAYMYWLRRRTWTCYWSILVTSTMVSDAASLSHNLRPDYAEGTGLTDGYPPDDVDGHEVRVQVFLHMLYAKTYGA